MAVLMCLKWGGEGGMAVLWFEGSFKRGGEY